MTDTDFSGETDPLAQYTAQMAELKTKAEEVQEKVRAATATASAPDGAASVTVGPSGALVNLTFGARAYRRPPEALASLVLSLVGQAQRQVSGQVAAAFEGMVGEGSAAMDVLNEFLPADPDADADEQPPQAPPAPPPPPPPPPRPFAPPPPPPPSPPPRPAAGPRRSPGEDEDEDFTDPW